MELETSVALFSRLSSGIPAISTGIWQKSTFGGYLGSLEYRALHNFHKDQSKVASSQFWNCIPTYALSIARYISTNFFRGISTISNSTSYAKWMRTYIIALLVAAQEFLYKSSNGFPHRFSYNEGSKDIRFRPNPTIFSGGWQLKKGSWKCMLLQGVVEDHI